MYLKGLFHILELVKDTSAKLKSLLTASARHSILVVKVSLSFDFLFFPIFLWVKLGCFILEDSKKIEDAKLTRDFQSALK